MEFFENAVNKAKDVFDAACKKTGEVVSVQKQKYDIAGMKSNLNKSFEDFGRACLDFVLAEGDITDEAKSLAAEIVRKKEEIAQAKAELDKAQGKKECPNCGFCNVSEAHYCTACGYSFIGNAE